MDERIVKGVKFVLKNITGIGITLLCSAMVGRVASASNAGFLKKSAMALGGLILSGMLAKEADKYLDDEVDEGVTLYGQIVDAVNKVKTTVVKEGE